MGAKIVIDSHNLFVVGIFIVKVNLDKPVEKFTVEEAEAIVRAAARINGRRGGAPEGNKNAKGNKGGRPRKNGC